MKAFKPAKLPLDLYVHDLLRLNKKVIKANKLITEFNAKLKYNKFNNFLFFMFNRKEAISSTKIEGTQSTLNTVLEAEITNKKNDDTTEVLNYISALSKGKTLLRDLPICTRLIQAVHKEMLKSGRGHNSSIGNYRKIQNWIGSSNNINTAQYIPPEPQYIDEYMSNLEEYINSDSDIDDLIKIAIIHAQFETIHPFIDGNGRVGRILIILYLYNRGLIDDTIFYINEEIESKKLKYYSYLNGVRNNKWFEFIDFFLDCIINQADKSIDKIDKVNELYKNIERQEIVKNKYLEFIFKSPVFTAKKMSEDLNISFSTARTIIKKLEEKYIIYSNGNKRNGLYFFIDFIDIF